MFDDEEETQHEPEPNYPGIQDLPDPDHHRGPIIPQVQYNADMLNFLAQTVSDTFYPKLCDAINAAPLTDGAKTKLQFLADKYIMPSEYVVTNVRNDRQYRSIWNDLRMDAASSKVGLRRIDYNNHYTSILSAMENHLKGAKLTRSYEGFERVSQQTQRAELNSTYEQKQPPKPPSGISRLIGRG